MAVPGSVAQPRRGRHEPAASRRCGPGHRRRRRAARARPRQPPGRVGGITTRGRCREGSRPTCWPRCRDDPCTLDDVVVDLAPADRRRGDGPRPPRAHRLGARGRRWFEPVVSWSGQTMSEYPRLGCRGPALRRTARPRRRRSDDRRRSAWHVDSFAMSLSSLSDHTVAAYGSDVRGFAEWAARAGIDRAGRRRRHDPAALPRLPHDARSTPGAASPARRRRCAATSGGWCGPGT